MIKLNKPTRTSQKVFRRVAMLTLPIIAISGCSSTDDETQKPIVPVISTTVPKTTVSSTTTTAPINNNIPTDPSDIFQSKMSDEDSFSASDCYRSPDNWVVNIDDDPNDIEDYSTTVGLAKEYDGEKPVFGAGVRVKGLGAETYRLSTSDEPYKIITIDLKEGPYAQVLKGEEGKYSTVYTATKGNDGKVYHRLNCLPQFGFFGDQEVVPLLPLPEEPTIPADLDVQLS